MVHIDIDEVNEHPNLIENLIAAQQTGVVVRRAVSQSVIAKAVKSMGSPTNESLWESPNTGMQGGEIRTIGAAATPTFTAFRGPTAKRYGESAQAHAQWDTVIFGETSPTGQLQTVFSALFGGRPAHAPRFDESTDWLPYNCRALDPGIQIYSHHDNHYGLDIYQHLDASYDRSTLMSWFVTLQPAQYDGELIIYGLWGSDPDPPMLPTRFVDTAALERDYHRCAVPLQAGDLVIFDSGRHVHRVTPVGGQQPRLTFGGFLTVDSDRTQLAFWS